MTQKLITRNSDRFQIDFGLSVEYNASGVRAVGRTNNKNYRGAWSDDGSTSSTVTISDVADDYEFSVPTPTPAGRDLKWDEFLDVGMATDPTRINAILTNMPIVAEYGRLYTAMPGIRYKDATHPGSRLKRLLDAAVAAQLLTDETVTALLGIWVVMYPAGT